MAAALAARNWLKKMQKARATQRMRARQEKPSNNFQIMISKLSKSVKPNHGSVSSCCALMGVCKVFGPRGLWGCAALLSAELPGCNLTFLRS